MVEHIKEVLRESVNRKDSSYARNNLTEGEKDYFFNNLDFFNNFKFEEKIDYDLFDSITFSIYTQEQAISRIKNIEGMELEQKVSVISCLPNDEMKLKYLLPNDEDFEEANAFIVSSLSSDKLKIEKASSFTDDESKAIVLKNLSNDKIKLENLNLLRDENEKLTVLESLSNDELKIKILSSSLFEEDYQKSRLIRSLSNDKEKIKSLSFLKDDRLKAELIAGLSLDSQFLFLSTLLEKNNELESKDLVFFSRMSDEEKKNILNWFRDDPQKIKILFSYLGDVEKTNYIYFIGDDVAKIEIIKNMNFLSGEIEIFKTLSEKTKLKNLSLFKDGYDRALAVATLSNDEQKFNYLLSFSSLRDMITIAESFSEDKWLLKSLALSDNKEYKLKIIKHLSPEEQLVHLNDMEETAKIEIIKQMSDEYKIKSLSKLSEDKTKVIVLALLPENIIMNELNYLSWFSNEKNTGRTKKLKIIKEYQKILQEKDFKYLGDNFLEYLEDHHENLDESSISHIVNILNRFIKSNSLELSNLKEQLTPLVLSTQNPIESFNKIEKIFLKNNIPMFGKEFLCFQNLYPEFQKEQEEEKIFDFTEESRISPELLHPTQTRKMKAVSRNATDKDIRFQIVFNDLLRIASRSNNRSLIEYLNNIEYGNTLFLGISKGIIKFNDLDDKSKQILDVFSNHLAALYENTKKGSEEIFENLSTVEKVTYFSQKFSPTSRYDLPDRIVRSFAYQAGIESFEQLKNIVINSVREKEAVSKKKSEELKQGKKLVLEPGDFVRAIGNIDCVESSLNNGNVCKEFLGTFLGKSDSDTTPLDVDLTLITEENTDIYHNIKGTPTGFGFGNVYVILKKDNPNLNITRDKEGNLTGNEYDPSKVEVFGTKTLKGGYETHWGARTGIASSDIDYILFKEDLTIDPENPYSEDGKVNYILPKSEFEKKEYYENHQNDLAILKNEVVKNGFYIPIVDFSGKIIFTYEEYQELKQKMEGLSHYGSKEYHLKQHQYSDYTERIKGLLASNKRETKIQSQKLYQALSDIIQSIPMDENSTKTLQAKNKIGIDLTPGSVEVLETGSSVRGTNVPYDFDFDYIFRLDSNIINDDKKMHQFRTKICEALNIASVPSGDFRDVEATIPGLGTIKLDITFIQKNDKVEYSTEMALQDRMDTIYKSNPAVGDEVTANIILAKLLLKQAGCYKPERKDPNQGGLGGVGIENWITQNGGTLETAANSFLKASEGKTYEEFKLIYHIHDYGKNHLYKEKKTYPYDDFIFNNMNRIGYQKMQEVLRKYIRYLSGEKDLFPELEEVLNALEQQQEKEVTTTHSRGIVSFFILISLSLLVSIITIIYILLRK